MSNNPMLVSRQGAFDSWTRVITTNDGEDQDNLGKYENYPKSSEVEIARVQRKSGHVFLRITPTIEAGRAIKSIKLIPKLIGPYQILSQVDPITYQMALPLFLSK
ncbi:hypothetical protein CR513_50895, partial [Mucuna pruriens]